MHSKCIRGFFNSTIEQTVLSHYFISISHRNFEIKKKNDLQFNIPSKGNEQHPRDKNISTSSLFKAPSPINQLGRMVKFFFCINNLFLFLFQRLALTVLGLNSDFLRRKVIIKCLESIQHLMLLLQIKNMPEYT